MPRSALERSQIYRDFAAAFRTPDGGGDLFGPGVLPAPPPEAAAAFAAAYEPALDGRAASLHGRSYLNREQADLFEELVRWYSFFDLKRAPQAELPDHVAVELDFLQFLTWREHMLAGDFAALHGLRKGQRDFIQRHLLPMAHGLTEALAGRDDRYGMLPRRLADFLAEEASDLAAGVSP